ncbi:GntR family transcriptional regulator [Cryobacterium frigoriphilum]|uniref:GntR family transcriptional regulator n=1 Tax=Cryobacterium frigoriphilum TaxID=1259150 RepID=UPI001F541406|nr:FCD domain-containing protein [Cryobacterium frigoriphilum]
MSLIDLDEVSQAQFIRESLETNALRYACDTEDRDFSIIQATIAEQRRIASIGDSEAFFLADEAFHQQTFDLAGYSGAWSVVGRSRFQLDRIRRLSIGLAQPQKLAELCSEHEEIVRCVVSRDAERAVEKLRTHIRRYIVDGPGLRKAYPDYFVCN